VEENVVVIVVAVESSSCCSKVLDLFTLGAASFFRDFGVVLPFGTALPP
jgi:hypothetical protein